MDETETALVIPTTETGVEEFVVVPSPRFPYELEPQHLAEPSARTAQSVVSDTASDIPTTLTGVRESVVDPSPSCPEPFAPQHLTEPELSNAQV